MSGYFRRIIANRILRSLSKHGKLDAVEIERLERNVALLVQTQDVFIRSKARLTDPQYRLDVEAVSKVTGVLCDREIIDSFKSAKDTSDGVILNVVQENNSLLINIKGDAFQKQVLQTVQNEGMIFGSRFSTDVGRERPSMSVVVEYSSPNIAKPFHAGHLRSTIIGNFVANLYEHVGHNVQRLNFLGDWGTQFGLLAAGFKRYGNEKLLKDDPLLHLFEVYVKINKEVDEETKAQTGFRPLYEEGLDIFWKLEHGDQELLQLWKRFRDISLEEYSKMYQRLGVKFTQTQYESDYSKQTKALVASLKDQGLLQFDTNGVGFVVVNDRGTEIQAKLVKSDGSSLYLARDVVAALERQAQFSPNRVHYVVDMGQQLHFKQLLGVLQQLKVPWAARPLEEVHVQFGRVEGMSSRRGTVVFLRDILDEARDRLMKDMQSRDTTRTSDIQMVADRLAVSAVVVQDLKGKRRGNYEFSWDRMLSFNAESGIFLQYAHARLCSLVECCGVEKTPDVDVTCIRDEEIHQLVLHLAKYPDIIDEMLTSLEPCTVVQYLLKLCRLVNAAYAKFPVKGAGQGVAQARLLAFDGARQVLSNGLQLIGLQPLKEM